MTLHQKGGAGLSGYETFAACLKRCLIETGMRASEISRMLGHRSRTSVQRILQGDTSDKVNARFLQELEEALGKVWPKRHFDDLREALLIAQLGAKRYLNRQAFRRVLHEPELPRMDIIVQTTSTEGVDTEIPLADLLDDILRAERIEIVITGCCEVGLLRLLAEKCAAAGDAGKLAIRHYIDTTEDAVVGNILGIMPLVNHAWYNARLVGAGDCPIQMLQLYRLHALYINCWDEKGSVTGSQMTCVDERTFLRRTYQCLVPTVQTIDRWRSQLELLKPVLDLGGNAEGFLLYTQQYAKLEEKCTILSIKPDVHFNCIPPAVLEKPIAEGFSQAAIAAGDALDALMRSLWVVHERRFNNLYHKKKPTHLVYSRPAMVRFMHTGVLTDHFFLQRPYTVEERRTIIRTLRDAMQENPWFNVHFLKEDIEPRKEISAYGDRGVMIMDAMTGYELSSDHSEALISLPAFIRGYQEYFMNNLLTEAVTSRSETLAVLEELINI